MLEAQKDRMYERSRLRAKGASEEEIAKIQTRAFIPAFVNGKRRPRSNTQGHAADAGTQAAASHQAH